eukprot:gene10771-19563_t
MAEGEEESSSSLEADLITHKVQLLIDPNSSAKEDQIQNLELLLRTVTERENEILESLGEDDKFYSVLLSVAAHRVGTWIESCKEFADLTLKAADLILRYCLDRIHSTKTHSFFSKLMLIRIVEGICLARGCLEKQDLTLIANSYDTLTVPKSLQKSTKTAKQLKSSFGLITSLSQIPLHILQQRIENLSEELVAINSMVNIPSVIAVKPEELQRLGSLVCRCIKATLFVSIGSYEVICEEEVKQTGRKEGISLEDLCRKYTWRATETSLSIFKSVLTAVNSSTRFGGAIYQNVQAIVADAILSGFKLVLAAKRSSVSGKEEAKEISRKWKWFSGLNIMLVTMASRVVTLMLSLIEDLELESLPQGSSSEKSHTINYLSITTQCSAWQRMQWLLARNNLPHLLWNLFRASYSMAIKIKDIKTTQAQEQARNEEKQNEASESERASAAEDSGEEEGSLLGQWLENIMSESTTSRVEPKKDKVEDGKSEVAYTQSLDIFVLLGNNLLDLCTRFFPICMKYNLSDIVDRNFTKDGLKSLAEMVNEIDKTADDLSSKEDIGFCFRSYLIMLHSSKVLDQTKLEFLLSELGLGVDYKQPGDWPLYVSPTVLSLFARLALSEQDACLRGGSSSADTPRSIYAWKGLLHTLAKSAQSLPENMDLNVEHIQTLAALYLNFSDECKRELIKTCIDALGKIAARPFEDFPLRTYRLVVILDFMFRCFSRIPNQLLLQVSKNILNIAPKIDGIRQQEFISCTFKEEEAFRNLVKRMSPSPMQNSFQQQQPRFYELLAEDFSRQSPDFKVFQFIQDFDIASASYKDLYQDFLNLSVLLLQFIESHHAEEESILQIVAARSCFQHIWKFFQCMPPPILLLQQMLVPEKALASSEMILFFLRVIPMFYANRKRSVEEIAKIVLMFDEVINDDALKLVGKLVEECQKTAYLTQLIMHVASDEGVEILDGKCQWIRLMLIDALSSMSHVLFERLVSCETQNEEDKEMIAKMAWLVLNNTIACHRKIKNAVITHNNEKISQDIVAVYSKLIGTSTTHTVKDAGELNFDIGLPSEIKQASEKWKDALLTQFPSPKKKTDESGVIEEADLSSFLDGLINAHVSVCVTGISFKEPAFTLKHLLKSSIGLMHDMLEWLKKNSENHFQMIQVNAITAFVNIATDSIVDHVADSANQILEMTVGSGDGDRLQEIIHSHLLSLCFFVVDEEINRVDRFITSEQTVLQCLAFIESSLQRSEAPCSAASYFSTGYYFKLASILLSIRLSKFSKFYASRVLQMFSNLLLSPDNAQQGSVRKAVVQIFSVDAVDLQDWLFCEIMSDSNTEEEGSKKHGIMALQKFVNCIIQEQEGDLDSILDSAMNVFAKLIKLHIESPNETRGVPYGDFLEVLVNIASAVGAKGHLKLLQAVQNWISLSRIALAANFKDVEQNSVSVDDDLMSCIASLLRYIHQILSAMKKYCLKESSSLTLQLSYSESDYGSKDRTEADIDDEVNTDDEDSGGEESEEESLCNKLCSFTMTQRDFMDQHWYHCHTCKMNDGVGCCTTCAKVCHKDHDVTYAKYGSFFCDCGAKEDGSCKAMTKRTAVTGLSNTRSMPSSPFTAWSAESGEADKRQRGGAASEAKPDIKRGKSIEKKPSSDNWFQDTSFIHLLSSLLKESKDEIIEALRSEKFMEMYMSLLRDLQEYRENVNKFLWECFHNMRTVHQALQFLYCNEKDVQTSDQLMIPILGSQEGAFESVRLNFSGEQGQTLRQLINAHVLRHSAMCLMASTNGKKQHLAVTHEKGKITILQLSGLLKQPDTASRKLTLNRLSSTTLPFTIVSIHSNPENDDALAVCGLKDCHVITYGHSGSVVSHLALPLQLETGNFVIKAIWVAGEQTKLALLTADFVKVYDLSKSVSSPIYYYILPGGKVRDATFINDGTSLRIAVMSSHGHIYTEVMNEASNASGGAFFLTDAVMVSHPTLKDSNGQVAGGGVSLYYSHVLKLVFFSYSQGKSFIGVPNKSFSEMENIFNLSTAVSSHSALCQWHEIAGQPGLLHCVNQSTGNPVLVMVRPEKILIQEIKGSSSKTKIQDAVCYYHMFPVTRSTDTTIQQKTTMIILLEDGSLRIYNAHKEYASYWLKNKFKPKPFVPTPSPPRKTKTSRAIASSMQSNAASFPIDFFEHCQATNDIEFGGSDILHIYNSQQVKYRLNSSGMYIASTKASGFKIEISNTNTSNVMVGLRVHVGMQSLEKIPTYIEVFGRVIPLRLSRGRWFDIPFTKAESLTADKKITVTFGPSSDSSGINMVDSIKVHCKTKESFGWPEDPHETAAQGTDVPHEVGSPSRPTDQAEYVDVSMCEPLLTKLLETLHDHLVCFPIDEEAPVHQELLDFATKLVTALGPARLQNQAKSLMASLFSSRNDFFDKKDDAQIKYALDRYKTATADDKQVSNAAYIESIQELLIIARAVGNARPKNLIKALKEFDKDNDVLDSLMASFWKLYAARPVNYMLAPIEARAIGTLDGTIEALVEVLFAVLLGDSDRFQKLMDIIINLLLSKDTKVSFAAKQGLSQAMQLRRKVTVVPDPSPTQSESPGIEELNQGSTLKDEIQEAADQQQPVPEIQENSSFAEGVIEELEPQQNGLQVLLGGAGGSGDNTALLEGPAASGELSRLRKGSHDSERSCPPSSKNNKVVEITDVALEASWSKIFNLFIDRLQDLKTADGVQAIPFLQVLLMLCSSLTDSAEDQQSLEKVVSACLDVLDPDDKVTGNIAERSPKREVQLVIIRFFSVLMSQSRPVEDVSRDKESSEARIKAKPGKTVAKILAEKGIVGYCLQLLESLLPHWRELKTDVKTEASDEDEVLLKVKPYQNPPDMSPFFLKQYVKSHANDLFEAFPQLVTEMVLRMPYQIWKRLENLSDLETGPFDKQWIHCLCEYMMANETPFIKRHVRKLLLALCGSKEKYRRVKDVHTLKSHVSNIRSILQPSSLSDAQASFTYEDTVRLADNCKACADIAMARVDNWQAFCKEEKGSCRLSSEHVSGMFLQLIGLALGNSSQKSTSSKVEDRPEKAGNKGHVKELVGILFESCYSSLLSNFIKFFLLESNSTSMRWKAHELMYTVFRNVSSDQCVRLVELMWQLWRCVPFSGHKAAQFVDLLGYFTVKTPEIKDKMKHYTKTICSLLSFSNNLLMNHPNASVYKRLQSLVEVGGFYLENDPCIVCNNPEIPFAHTKLTSIKSDIRYTTTAQLVKLNVNYTISRLLLRISDIKRAKMVKTINIYYNNKPVPSVVELKNKKNIWQRAKRITLTAEQTDVKVDFTLPIVAYNLMIEYADFYDNIQLSAESLQCPRCSASVPANPGVCGNCGENVYQCHKCRAINYDERDPFLCTSCGFCKYAKFEYTLVTRPCCAVEPVNDETERQSALNSVNTLLESADKIYQQLSNHKQSLETSLRSVSEESSTSVKAVSASSAAPGGAAASSAALVNKNIQSIAQKYCNDCKTSFEELSKIIQKVTATRKELSSYDQRQQEALSTIVATSPGASPDPTGDSPFSPMDSLVSSKGVKRQKDEIAANMMGKCYGCALYTVGHCLTILRAFATVEESHNWMLSQGLLHELLEHSLQHKRPQVTSLAQKLIILMTTGNFMATNELNQMIMRQVSLSLESKAANVISDISLQSQMSVLGLSLNALDDCWDDRLRCVFNLFLDSMRDSNTDVLENVTLPCLKIIAKSIQDATTNTEEKGTKDGAVKLRDVNAVKWLNGSSQHTLAYWRAKNPVPSRDEYLAEKYGGIWLRKLKVQKKPDKEIGITGEAWLRLLLFAPSSRAIRETVCGILENLCQVESKKKKLLHIFTKFLEDLHAAGENASDFFSLFKNLIKSSDWKRYLVECGLLERVTLLIIKEVDYLNSLENKTVGFDLSQGFALHALADILKMLFEDDVVKTTYKSKFVGHVLQCYLSLRRLVVQRTKLIDDAQDILLALLEELTTGTEAEERAFMAVCISALKEYPVSDIRTPVFIFERLCNIIHKEEKEVDEFFLIIEKDPQQEDFLQGRMPGNPYSSKESGLGPLMRDIKNKICTECELVALLEDDTGMELLVNNKIISLDLPVSDVYKKIWCAKGDRPEAMKIVYRMRGLLGDATEDMVENLESDKDKDIDEEHEYRQAAVISEVGGLDVILKRLSHIRNLSRAQELISVMLKLFEYCVKVKVNRQYLGKPSVNSLKILLGTLNLALRLEKERGSTSGGAMIAERLLNIMGIVLHEASEQADQYQLSSLPGEESQLELLLGHITSPYVRTNPNVLEAMMRLIPSLSFGSEQSMRTLINHFLPYLNFNSFDQERTADETLYLECFCVISNGISNTLSGSRLKDLIIDHHIPQRALDYLTEHTPPKSFSASGILDANKWKEFLVRPALPYVLRILTGLVGGHSGTQNLVGTEENIAVFHRLEQVSSAESVGSLAENLVEALRENPIVAKKVHAVRRQTREDKKKMALAMRQKQLEALGMVVTEGGQIKAKPSSVIKEMEELLEEKGLICCICREGYKFHPKKVLGIYTYTTRCVLDEFENKPRKTQGYSSVSHFNVIHVDCHSEAIRHARSRDEWESAALQNANTKCNGLIPIWGPKHHFSLVVYEVILVISLYLYGQYQ